MGLVSLHVTAYLGFSSPRASFSAIWALALILGWRILVFCRPSGTIEAAVDEMDRGNRRGRQQRLFIARTLKALSVRGTCRMSSTCFETQITRKCCGYNPAGGLFFCCPLISKSSVSCNPSVFLSRTQFHLISPGFFGPSIQLPYSLYYAVPTYKPALAVPILTYLGISC